MANWRKVTFQIVKQTDKALLGQMRKVFDESPYGCNKVRLQPVFMGAIAVTSLDEATKNELVAQILREGSELLETLAFDLDAGFTLTITRANDTVTVDTLTFGVDQANRNPAAADDAPKVCQFVALLRKHFHPVDAVGEVASLLGKEIAEHYQRREAELGRLEQLSVSVTEDLAEHRHRLEAEYKKKRDELEQEVRTAKDKLEAAAADRQEALVEREKALEARLADVDQKESRFARRALRKDLKEQLARRSEKFELTKGTRSLRKPIWLLSVVLLILFGTGAVTYAVLGAMDFATGEGLNTRDFVTLAVRQAIFTLGFVGMGVFLIRWSNRWFDKHAMEEFRQKRFELDLDRASWLVEMAMEWQKETGSEIPASLVDRLGNSLFEEQEGEDEPLHPADQLASALLGASANATLKLPGAGEVTFDRKGLRKLSKVKIEAEQD